MSSLVSYLAGDGVHDDYVWNEMVNYWGDTGQLSEAQLSGASGQALTTDEFYTLGVTASYGPEWDWHDFDVISDAEWAGIGGVLGGAYQMVEDHTMAGWESEAAVPASFSWNAGYGWSPV